MRVAATVNARTRQVAWDTFVPTIPIVPVVKAAVVINAEKALIVLDIPVLVPLIAINGSSAVTGPAQN